MNVLTSIIIRTDNEEQKIGQCLHSVFNQKVDQPFEVIIVDSESNDQTLAIASKFPVKVIKITKKEFSYGWALNFGFEQAAGQYLVSLSAHAIIESDDWLTRLISHFKDQSVAGVYSKEIPLSDCNPLTKRQLIAHHRKILKTRSKYSSFSNAGSMMLKSVWEKFKFSEDLIASEDYEWAKRVEQAGYQIIYEPEAIIKHSHNESFKQIFYRYYREFYSTLLINKKKIYFNYLILGPYYFCQDLLYILKNHYNLIWISRSLASNLLLFVAAVQAIIRRLAKNV